MIVLWVFIITLLLVLYTYVLYPLFALLVGSRRHSLATSELVPISFLVPAHNEASVIAAKIANFHALDYPLELTELLIADDGSTDGTSKLVEPHLTERIRLLASTDRNGKAASMNMLVAAAKHPYLLMSDANVMLTPNVPRKLTQHLSDARVGAVTGEVRLIGSHVEFNAGESLYYWMERRIQSAESRIGSVMGVDGGMYLLVKKLFQPLPTDTILDDFLVSMNVIRQNYRVVYDGSAKAIESGTPTTKQEFARRVRIAAGAVQLLRRCNVPNWNQPIYWFQFVSHKVLRWLSPVLFLLLFLTNCVLLAQDAKYQAFLFLQLAVILLVVLTWQLPSIRKTRFGAVVFYFGFSQVAMLLGLFKGLANLQIPQWEKANRSECESSSLD